MLTAPCGVHWRGRYCASLGSLPCNAVPEDHGDHLDTILQPGTNWIPPDRHRSIHISNRQAVHVHPPPIFSLFATDLLNIADLDIPSFEASDATVSMYEFSQSILIGFYGYRTHVVSGSCQSRQGGGGGTYATRQALCCVAYSTSPSGYQNISAVKSCAAYRPHSWGIGLKLSVFEYTMPDIGNDGA
jgi:hypothetical protein